jgi:hypothetical protein
MQIILTAGIIILFIVIFMGSLYLNAHTEIPESAREAYEEASSCGSCTNAHGEGHSCGFKSTLEFLKEVKLK